jgi:hypothetical protein
MPPVKIRVRHIILIAASLFTLLISGTLLAQTLLEPKVEPVGSGGAGVLATGGPDAFGYTFADQADGCAYQFIDISATGTFIVDGDDSAVPVTLVEPFNIYGTLYNALSISANGYISTSLSDTGSDLSNDCPLPSLLSTGSGSRLYPLHDDIDMEEGIGRVLTQYFDPCPRPSEVGTGIEACTVFQWDDAAHFPGSITAPTFDFQAILYHASFSIVYQIGPGNPELGSGSTTGLQSEDLTSGLTYVCNTANSIPDNTAVCIFNPQGDPLLPPPTATPTAAPAPDVPVIVGDPVPLCSDLDGTTSPIVRASLPPFVYATFCSIIAENGVFRRSAAEIGVQSVLDMGVIHAVDVFSPSGESGAGTGICLQGAGSIVFLASSGIPRVPVRLPSAQSAGYTCTTLPGTGTVVLVIN